MTLLVAAVTLTAARNRLLIPTMFAVGMVKIMGGVEREIGGFEGALEGC